jgi:hypothetical protein
LTAVADKRQFQLGVRWSFWRGDFLDSMKTQRIDADPGGPMAKTDTSTGHKIEEFAEDLGKLLGTARAKAEGWLGQRQAIAKHLEGIRDTANHLLQQLLGTGGAGAPTVGGGREDSVGSGHRGPGRPKGSGRKRRQMSAEARAKIAAAQKARWAKIRADKRK